MYLDDDELSSGNTLLQSSQLAEPVWTDPALKSGISVRELISTKKTQAGKNGRIFSENHRKRGKKATTISGPMATYVAVTDDTAVTAHLIYGNWRVKVPRNRLQEQQHNAHDKSSLCVCI